MRTSSKSISTLQDTPSWRSTLFVVVAAAITAGGVLAVSHAIRTGPSAEPIASPRARSTAPADYTGGRGPAVIEPSRSTAGVHLGGGGDGGSIDRERSSAPLSLR